jgi:hypothetical protein
VVWAAGPSEPARRRPTKRVWQTVQSWKARTSRSNVATRSVRPRLRVLVTFVALVTVATIPAVSAGAGSAGAVVAVVPVATTTAVPDSTGGHDATTAHPATIPLVSVDAPFDGTSAGASAAGDPLATTTSPSSLSFAGRSWAVKSSSTPVGPGPNVFDPKGPYVDSSGNLHLRIVKTSSGWEASEVVLNRSTGYGTYHWTIKGPVATIDPSVVLGLFTYDSSSSSESNRELDIEISRFGSASSTTNSQYVVQPYTTAGNRVRFRIPEGGADTVMSLVWKPGSVTFSGDTVDPDGTTRKLRSWTNRSSSVPNSSTQQVYMNLWLFRGAPPTNGKAVTIEVTGFRFTPAP